MLIRLYLLLLLIGALGACSFSSQAKTGLQGADKVSQKGLPAPLEAKDCGPSGNKYELPNDRFVRKGGGETRNAILIERGMLTTGDIAQGRDLNGYERLNVKDPEPGF